MSTISRKKVPWKDREHLFTPSNITRYEFACCKDCIYRKISCIRKAKALSNGPVTWIIKDGKPVDVNNLEEKGAKANE